MAHVPYIRVYVHVCPMSSFWIEAGTLKRYTSKVHLAGQKAGNENRPLHEAHFHGTCAIHFWSEPPAGEEGAHTEAANPRGVVNRRGFAYWNKWLPECASIRSGRRGAAEPEVWFRIVHITLEDTAGSTAYREQRVEIALGPKGAFENGNIGILTRQVPATKLSALSRRLGASPSYPRYPGRPRWSSSSARLSNGRRSSHLARQRANPTSPGGRASAVFGSAR